MARRILHPALLVRCWGSCDFHKFSAQRTAVTPLSRAARASSPQGEPWCGAFPQAFCKSPLQHGRPMAAPTMRWRFVGVDLLIDPSAQRPGRGGGMRACRPTVRYTQKNRLAFASRFSVLALPIFPCRQSIVTPLAGLNVLCRIGMRKATCRWQVAFQMLALPIFPCRQSIVPSTAGPDVLSIICKKSACRWQADFLCWRYLSSRAVTRKVLSAKVSLTSVFGMGTGGPSPQSTPTASKQIPYPSPRSKAQGSVTPLLLLSNAKLVLHWV